MFFEDANIGQKRKRVATRKAVRDEQKRRELEHVGDAFLSYVPPPKPPIKAKDVPVPVVRDVSFIFHFFIFFFFFFFVLFLFLSSFLSLVSSMSISNLCAVRQ